MSGYDSALIGLEIIEHPNLLELPRGVRFVHIEAIVWSRAHYTDGSISRGALRRLTDEPDTDAAAAALVQAGRWAATDTGWRIVDFDQHQDTATEIEARRQQHRDAMSRYRAKLGVHSSNGKGDASRDISSDASRDPVDRPTDRPTGKRGRESGGSRRSTARSPLNGGSPSPPLQLVPGKTGPAVHYLNLSMPCAVCHTAIPENDPVYTVKGRGDVVHPECGSAVTA